MRNPLSSALLLIILASSTASVLAQESSERKPLLARDSEQLQRDLAQAVNRLRSQTEIAQQLPPQALKARRCTELDRWVQQRRNELRAQFHHSTHEQLGQAFRAGIDAAPQQETLDMHKARMMRDGTTEHDEKLRELETAVYAPMLKLLQTWDMQKTTEFVVDAVLLELAAPQVAGQLECAGVIDIEAQASELSDFAGTSPEATLAYWDAAMRLLPDTDDPQTQQRKRLELLADAARRVALLVQQSEGGDDYYEAGIAALAHMTGGSRSRNSYRTMSSRLQDYAAIDLRLLTVSDVLLKRVSADNMAVIESLTGIHPVALRNRTSFVDKQLSVFTDRQAVEEMRAWAANTVEQMLDSPTSFEEALANILGE